VSSSVDCGKVGKGRNATARNEEEPYAPTCIPTLVEYLPHQLLSQSRETMTTATELANFSAQQRLEAKSRSYGNIEGLTKSDGSVRHKCFLSYHHTDAVEVEAYVNSFEPVFIPKVIGITDYGDVIQSQSDDYIMDIIREKYLTDSTVSIVFIGKFTYSRKYIDWEVLSSLRNDVRNRRSGLVAVELPSVKGVGRLPKRVLLNTGVKNSGRYARYWAYPTSTSVAQFQIQDAFDARLERAEWIELGGPKQAENSLS